MLNKEKIIKQLNQNAPQIFLDITKELEFCKQSFNWLKNNPKITQAISKLESNLLMPTWEGLLDQNYYLNNYSQDYTVLAVDGSQIYPDRNQGISCFLINIGFTQISYSKNSKVYLNSEPHIFFNNQEFKELSPEIVNCYRTELELINGLEFSKKIVQENNTKNLNNINKNPFIFLCDGSLIFWHLENKDKKTKDRFLNSYISIFDQFYKNQIPIFGFISFPKSKELVNIMKVGLKEKIIPINLPNNLLTNSYANLPKNLNLKFLEYIFDSDIASLFLKPFYRSAVFSHNSSAVKDYPEHLKPKFCYIDTDQEIIRVEFPAWIQNNTDLLQTSLEIIIDQCIKGRGYPIALAESHEQAVVKSADREFFYDQLYKISLNSGQNYRTSQKSIKKRLAGI